MTVTTINIDPHYDEEQSKRIQAALDKQGQTQAECMRILKELIDTINWDDGSKRVARVIDEYYGKGGAGQELIAEAIEILKAAEDANEVFMRSLVRAPK